VSALFDGRAGKEAAAMKFTTLIPKTQSDGTPVRPFVLDRLIDSLWKRFRGMTDEGTVTGHWIDEDGTYRIQGCVR
jgi:hypothetical protein